MSGIPFTRTETSKAEQCTLRNAVRNACEIPGLAKLATNNDVEALFLLLRDPAISEPIYTVPKPVTRQGVSAFIQCHFDERECGDGLLMVAVDGSPAAAAYYDIQFWPNWSACELGGAIRADRQNAKTGVSGAVKAFDWLFRSIGVDVICETAALDNIRTQKLLEHLGFQLRGEIESELPGGGTRPSLCWEMTREEWRLSDWASHV